MTTSAWTSCSSSFPFQRQRSFWTRRDHLTIARTESQWLGFPDLVQTLSGKLICTYTEGVGHGGGPRVLIQVEATNWGTDQGYSGWFELSDGRILVLNYTDDTALVNQPAGYWGRSWIRGTFLGPADLE